MTEDEIDAELARMNRELEWILDEAAEDEAATKQDRLRCGDSDCECVTDKYWHWRTNAERARRGVKLDAAQGVAWGMVAGGIFWALLVLITIVVKLMP